jgi:hypothetical protein
MSAGSRYDCKNDGVFRRMERFVSGEGPPAKEQKNSIWRLEPLISSDFADEFPEPWPPAVSNR